MSRRSVVLVALILALFLTPACSALPQCSDQITLVPLHKMEAASKARDFVRFTYPLSPTDSIQIRSHEDPDTSLRPYDTGYVITRDAKTLKRVSLRELSEFRREDPDYSESFTALAVTRACSSGGPIYLVTMQYMGDMTSPALIFTVVPSAQGYEVSTLPTISGGVLEVSRANPLHLRTWDNLHEGECEACPTRYEITEYETRDGKPVRKRQYRTRHLYSDGNYRFDDGRRMRFIP